MNNIKAQLLNFKVEETTKATSQRAETIERFLKRLNKDRENTPFKPLTARAVAIKLSHLDQWDLDIFYKQCEQANHFSKHFWWALKVQK